MHQKGCGMAPAARLLAFANFVLFGKDKVMIGKKGLAWPWPPPRGARILSAGQGGGFGKKELPARWLIPVYPSITWSFLGKPGKSALGQIFRRDIEENFFNQDNFPDQALIIKDPIFHLKILPGNPGKSAHGQILRKTFSCQPSIRWIFLINDTTCFKPIFFGLESSIVQEMLRFEIIQGQFQPCEQKGIVPPVAEGSWINTLLSVRSI